jgi:multiple sugar transport system permease protein
MTKSRAKYFFLLPGVIWVLLFTIFPLLYSLYLSFTNARLGRATQWIGLENYGRIFTDSQVTDTLLTSVFYSLGSLILTMFLGTFIAWLFNHDLPGVNQLRAILTMPLFAAPIALGFLGVTIFNEVDGPINSVLRGLGGQGVQWIVNPWGARFAVLIVDVWQWTPFVFIVALAAMQSVPDELLEAARLDTASGWAIFRSITFPLIAPALGTVALLRLVETFKILDVPVSLTQGGPGLATRSYAFQVYQNGLREFELGYASAMAYLLVILASVIAGIYFWRVRARFE